MSSPVTTAAETRTPRVVIAGNPNAGKTTLFNRLTGATAKVGNYPGITVEVERGRWQLDESTTVELLDVPGAYSLSANSEDERVAIAAIAGLPPTPRPDAVVIVADATELARHLYLALQVRELGRPTVVAMTMVDQLESQGLRVDFELLTAELGLTVVPVLAKGAGRGLDDLAQAVKRAVEAGPLPGARGTSVTESDALQADVTAVAEVVEHDWTGDDPETARALARWALLTAEEPHALDHLDPAIADAARVRRQTAHEQDRDLEQELIASRYQWIDERIDRFVIRETKAKRSLSDRADSILLHPVFGFAIFAVVMTGIFQALFVGADPAIGWIEDGVAALADLVQSNMGEGLFRDFVVNGVIEGVGAVVVFLPQILLMFVFLGILEATGYMARVVYLMDRVMRSVGLHGRAFVPMLSGFACAVPAILATRTMERRRDRILTILVVPLMTCSARLPVYGLMIAAIYPVGEESTFGQGALMAGMYLFSIAAAMGVAGLLGRTILRGKPAPFIQQMPPYRAPHMPTLARGIGRRTGIFLKEAGTVILVCTIAMWALLTFPRDEARDARFDQERTAIEQNQEGDAEEEALAAVDERQASIEVRESYAAQVGKGIEPVLEPLGFDWQVGVGLIGAFAAREVFVSTMAVVYGLDDEQDETSRPLREAVREHRKPDGTLLFTARTCLSLMIFFALACQCLSTVAAAKRETQGYAWPAFMLAYMTGLAWVSSFVVYQGMGLLGFD